MKAAWAAVALALAAPVPAAAQDFEFEFTEQALNRLIASVGAPSALGMHQPNILGTLGYSDCGLVATLDCPVAAPGGVGTSGVPGTPATPATPTAAGADRDVVIGGGLAVQHVPLLSCTGPDGHRRTVPGAEPVSWQWWINRAHLKVDSQGLELTASIRYRVGEQWAIEERVVPVTLALDVASQSLRMSGPSVKFPIRHVTLGVSEVVTEVDVGRYLSFAIPLAASTFQVHGLDGAARTLTSRVQSGNVSYAPGRVRVNVNATYY
jgi:hypothetical protein